MVAKMVATKNYHIKIQETQIHIQKLMTSVMILFSCGVTVGVTGASIKNLSSLYFPKNKTLNKILYSRKY